MKWIASGMEQNSGSHRTSNVNWSVKRFDVGMGWGETDRRGKKTKGVQCVTRQSSKIPEDEPNYFAYWRTKNRYIDTSEAHSSVGKKYIPFFEGSVQAILE